jgi:hypothetical protein
VLESGGNENGAISVVPNQYLYQANGTGEDVVRCRVIDRLVASYDTRVRGRIWAELIDFAQDTGLQLADPITEENGGVHV